MTSRSDLSAGDTAQPQNRRELLRQVLQKEIAAVEQMEAFVEDVIKPLLNFVEQNSSAQWANSEIFGLFSQYPAFIASRREYIRLLEDNCTAENISGPLGQWTAHVPRLLHFYAIAYHHYYLYFPKFQRLRRDLPEFGDFVTTKETEFGVHIQAVLENDIDYPRRRVPTFRLLDKYTDHTDVNAKPYKPTVDEVKTVPLIAAVEATVQKCSAARTDGIPDTIKSKGIDMKLTNSGRPATYGKLVNIDFIRPDKSIQKLTGKVISKISLHSQANLEQINQEISACQRFHHRNVLKLQMYLEDEVFHYLIFPATEKEDLRTIMTQVGCLPEEAARPIFRELMLGVQHIHSNGVIHGQITPSSVLFYKDHVKLSDFSLCTLSRRGEKTATKKGMMYYMSPESIKESPFDGCTNDIWSCGIMLYEMLSGELPFAGRSTKGVQNRVKRAAVVYPNTFSSSVIFLLKSMLNPTPHDRASIEQILSHPWMLRTREIPISFLLRPSECQGKRRSRPATVVTPSFS
jgi:serine/threonine protein kinase